VKKIGLIGGTSWHSTVEYYRYINQEVNDYFGNNTNPPLLVYTLNQYQIHQYQVASKWDLIAELLTEAALSLEKAGAEMILFCANTPHKVYDLVQARINKPILHIADATADAIHARSVPSVCFLGTKYSMTENFVTGRIAKNNIEILVPREQEQIDELHRIIQDQLSYGKVLPTSKKYVLDVIESLRNLGAKGVVLGCTEFPLMIFEEDLNIPIFNTTLIHAQAATKYILKDLRN